MVHCKWSLKNVILLIAVIAGLLLTIFFVFSLTNNPKTPATIEQVDSALEAQGFAPQDTTTELKKLYSNLNASINVKDGDFLFYFRSFSDDRSALQASQKYRSYLRDNRYHAQYNVETEENMANYSIYSIAVNDTYTVCARVGNTVVYAESSEADSNKIKNVMGEIGYFKKAEIGKPVHNLNEKALVYVIWFAISIPLTQVVCRWLWTAVCESAGKNPADITAHRLEMRGSSYTNRKLHSWLLSNSSNPSKTRKMMTIYQLCTAPAAVCLMFSVIGLFTHVFDKFLDVAAFVIMALIFLYAVAGVAYHINARR